MKKLWNFSVDCQPVKPYNIPEKEFLFQDEGQAVEACKDFCREYGFEFAPEMVAEITINEQTDKKE